MIDPKLYTLEEHEGRQVDLRQLLENLSGELEDLTDRGEPPLNRGQLLEDLATVIDAYMEAIDATPEQTLARLKGRAVKRLLAGGLILLDWAALLAAIGFGFAAAMAHDWGRVGAWITLLVAAVWANRLLVGTPECLQAEREQLRILATWDLGKACPTCRHGAHLPGACTWGAVEHNSAAAHRVDVEAVCACGELDEDQAGA